MSPPTAPTEIELLQAVKTVPWTRGEVRIPVAELRRFQRDGIPSLREPCKPPPPARRRRPSAGGDLDAELRELREYKIRPDDSFKDIPIK
jgi:hypothetical protein